MMSILLPYLYKRLQQGYQSVVIHITSENVQQHLMHSSWCTSVHLVLKNNLEIIWNCRKGDYYRYLAEFKTGNERKEAADQSLKAYEVFIQLFCCKSCHCSPLGVEACENSDGLGYHFLKGA